MTLNTQTVFSQQTWEFSDIALKKRLADAMDAAVSAYPIFRTFRFAANTELQNLFDSFALSLGLSAHRFHLSELLLDGKGLFITVEGSRKFEYCWCSFRVWADSVDRAEQFKAKVMALVEPSIIKAPMFSIDWHFLTTKGELQSADIEEMADDRLLDEAYPEVHGGITKFVENYLSAKETVLVLQGPPGTGKTRLIRAILGAMSHRSGGAQAMYTGDMRALQSDEIFVKFITGWDDAFVVEDADHLLRPRSEGNENLHRFLTIADGVVRSQGRKIIFSTNLPNIGDLDDALIRPGRCFARIHVRELTIDESKKLVSKLGAEQPEKAKAALATLDQTSERERFSLAELYDLFRR
jgi:energy-coupling factor transporter ATP-binding protein EcfA2